MTLRTGDTSYNGVKITQVTFGYTWENKFGYRIAGETWFMETCYDSIEDAKAYIDRAGVQPNGSCTWPKG